MARYQFRLPDIGEGIAQAEIVAWHVNVGDRVEEDAPLADMMTDKATVEMESPVAGKVIAVAGEAGDVIAIGSVLAVIEVESAGAGEEPDAPEPLPEIAPEPSPRIEPEPAPEIPPEPTPEIEPEPAPWIEPSPEPAPSPQPEPVQSVQVLASPAVRGRAHQLGIDLAQVKPAQDGRIRHADLDAYLSYTAGYRPSGAARSDEQVKVIGLRRRIAENMAASKRNIPHFTYVEECDVTALEEMRAQLNASRGNRPKLTMLPLLITAMCRTLPQFPMLNARYDDEAGFVTRHGAIHIGMATQTDAGLMVPVIRDAQDRNIWQLGSEIVRLAEAARNGSARSEELSGSTITVTSLGALGGVATTPVINRPEVAILGPNRIVERPMFIPDGMGGERIAKRKLMNISISCDHRVVDGWDAASFVQALKRLIEAPVQLLDRDG